MLIKHMNRGYRVCLSKSTEVELRQYDLFCAPLLDGSSSNIELVAKPQVQWQRLWVAVLALAARVYAFEVPQVQYPGHRIAIVLIACVRYYIHYRRSTITVPALQFLGGDVAKYLFAFYFSVSPPKCQLGYLRSLPFLMIASASSLTQDIFAHQDSSICTTSETMTSA